MKRKFSGSDPVLGIAFSDRTLYAILLQSSGQGVQVLRRFARQRALRMEGATVPAASGGQDFDDGEETDFTIQFGDGSGSGFAADLFLKSEFDSTGAAGVEQSAALARKQVAAFAIELRDILDECREMGYERPPVGICLGAHDVTYLEFMLQVESEKSSSAGLQKKLMDQLAIHHTGDLQTDRIGFLPMKMKESERARRYLALVPDDAEPVIPTLELLREEAPMRAPAIRMIDAEASLYAGMLRAADRIADGEKTVVVRVGQEDTLVLLLDGTELQHCEQLRSLTVFDPPETVCSRVLLQQDEQEIAAVHRVLLLADERQTGLMDAFKMFYPEAQVEALEDELASFGIQTSEEVHNVSAPTVLQATAVALRMLPLQEGWYEEVNLLPRRLMRRKLAIPVQWHALLALALLAGIVVFFGGMYMLQHREIEANRDLLRSYPPELANYDGRMLQQRIDSLQQVVASYSRALHIVDSLLVGSDRWSRMLEGTAAHAASLRGVWIDVWQPQGENAITLQGYATSRSQILSYAERLNASIEMMRFSEIRDWPVYDFMMVAPVPRELPAAARYLREIVTEETVTEALSGRP